MEELKKIEYFSPFKNVDDFNQACYIYFRLQHLNISHITKCIQSVMGILLSDQQLLLLIDKVKYFKEIYATKFLGTIDQIQTNIDNYLNENKLEICKFETKLKNCIQCNGILDHIDNTVNYKSMLYYASKKPQLCFQSSIKCKICFSNYFHNYYVTSDGKRYFYEQTLESEFISFTIQTVFERKLFEIVTADILFKHCTFKGFSESYNFTYSNGTLRSDLEEKRLAESWFYFHILKFHHNNQGLAKFNAPFVQNLDNAIKDIKPLLFKTFVKKWTGPEHFKNCTHPNCSKILNVDGLWKVNRLKCLNQEDHIATNELKPIQIGCRFTPNRGSYFCDLHKTLDPTLSFYINNEQVPIRISSIVAHNFGKHIPNIIKVHDSFCIDENDESEKVLYLIELDSKISSNFEKFCWVTENLISSELMQKFEADLIKRHNLEFYDEIKCNTNKHFKTPYVKKSKTKGLLISSYNCSIINGYREIFGSESISQVVIYYLDLISNCDTELPEYFIYDDACHVKRFVEKRNFSKISSRASILFHKKHYIDKLHFLNHKDAWCEKNCNPNKVDDLKNINTVVQEQINYWAGGYKHMLKHMNYYRFNFFLYIIFDVFNTNKLEKMKKAK